MPVSSVNPARGTLRSFPKRELSPLRRACISLGLPVDAQPDTHLARLLRKAGLGKTAIEYLKFSKDEQARQIVELYYSLKTATERKAVTIDHLIMAAGADVHHIWGVIQEWLSRITEAETTALVCVNSRNVAEKAIEYAKRPEGYKDRELVLRIASVVPTPPQPSGGRGVR